MPLTVDAITRDYVDDGSSLERIAHRRSQLKMEIVEYSPAWPLRFSDLKSRIQTALGPTAVQVHHAGSTSVPGLPAKDVIDVDLVVADIEREDTYVKPLESLGYRFLFREPAWHQHRFFVMEGDVPDTHPVNLHVFGPDCPEVMKHKIFRDWLVKSPDDLQMYAAVKREAATTSLAAGESMAAYTDRKNEVVKEIMQRAFRDLGYIK